MFPYTQKFWLVKRFTRTSLSGTLPFFNLVAWVSLYSNVYKNRVKIATFKISCLKARKWLKLMLMNIFVHRVAQPW